MDGPYWLAALCRVLDRNMDEQLILELSQNTLKITAMIASPMLIGALVVGLIISVLQAVTQINEATLTFIPKMAVNFLLTVWSLTPVGPIRQPCQPSKAAASSRTIGTSFRALAVPCRRQALELRGSAMWCVLFNRLQVQESMFVLASTPTR